MTSPVLNLNSLSIIFELFMLAFSLTTKSRKMNASCSISSTGIFFFFKCYLVLLKKTDRGYIVGWVTCLTENRKKILHAEKGRALSVLCNIYLSLNLYKLQVPALGLNGFCLSRNSHWNSKKVPTLLSCPNCILLNYFGLWYPKYQLEKGMRSIYIYI